ncbi:MAG: polysaccharide lyase family protein [Terriglobia bacterium]
MRSQTRWLPIVCLLACGLNLRAASTTIWQIGSFDKSSREFARHVSPTRGGALDYSNRADDPVYVIGKSQPGKNWLAFQPGTSNGKAGHRAHPFTIKFSISSPPRGVYTFIAALLAYTPRVPALDLSIYGRHGWFYQHPTLNYAAGDSGSVFAPRYSAATIVFDLPASYLKLGDNELVLTASDQPDASDDSEGAAMWLATPEFTTTRLSWNRIPQAESSPLKSPRTLPRPFSTSRRMASRRKSLRLTYASTSRRSAVA